MLEEIKRKTPGKKKKTLVDSSTESPSPILPVVNSPVIHHDTATTTLADLRKLTRNLQSQVNQLKQSQIELEATVSKMDQNDKLIMAELSGFQENLKKKDEIIRECLKLTVNNNNPPEPSEFVTIFYLLSLLTLPHSGQNRRRYGFFLDRTIRHSYRKYLDRSFLTHTATKFN